MLQQGADNMQAEYHYSCSECREQKRLQYINSTIEQMENEDKNGYYQEEVWKCWAPQYKQ